MVQINFDATQVEPNEGRPDPVPAGWYDVVIVESEAKQTQRKTGYFLALTYQIVSGEFKGRKVFQNINLQNPNEEAVRIGRSFIPSPAGSSPEQHDLCGGCSFRLAAYPTESQGFLAGATVAVVRRERLPSGVPSGVRPAGEAGERAWGTSRW